MDSIITDDVLFEITAIGLYSDPAADGNSYQVDEISLSSDVRRLTAVSCDLSYNRLAVSHWPLIFSMNKSETLPKY